MHGLELLVLGSGGPFVQEKRASSPRGGWHVVLDLAQLTALDKAGVDVLVELAYEAGEADIGLCLVLGRTPRDVVTGPLTDGDVLTLFDIHPTIADALDVLP